MCHDVTAETCHQALAVRNHFCAKLSTATAPGPRAAGRWLVGEVALSAGTIEYEDSGGGGPVHVFLHGAAMDGSVWAPVVADLRSDHRCVVADASARRPQAADAPRRPPSPASMPRRAASA